MNIDWRSWYQFLAIADCGSLNQAAEKLGSSQPTLSRQLLALETQLGRKLFDRSTHGLTLTDFGKTLLEESQNMAASADRLQRLAHGQDLTLSGSVRLSVNEMIAQYCLPALLPAFLNQYPDLQVQVVVTNQASNLDKRDADVAVRMFRPHQQDLVMRHLLDIGIGAYASDIYLDLRGIPSTPEALIKHRILGFDRDKQLEDGATALGWPIKNDDLHFRTDNMALMVEVAVNGGGIIFTHDYVANLRSLTHIDCGFTIPSVPVYLTCHRDVQHNQKIRVLMDFLAERLPRFIADYAGKQ
ncbi:HTH-type transcriptional activator CmpR [Grimontia celer]|uniref:HTH-type transcriptional activator CmpR n=1 Tax=Grimontia celer TaxID=1796497 RepID=A0A128EUH4_9GAMM|nr:LysR family transcriptional regulator [Grimontia celer]CZF78238.1 HTH-type transcriptional activator CmpR [Grimontia celer]